MDRFYLRFYAPLPAVLPADLETLRTDGISIDPRRTSLSFSTQLPGGFATLSAGFLAEFAREGAVHRTAWLSHPVESRPKGHLILGTAQGGVVWEGERTKATFPGGRLRGIEAQGYGTIGLEDSVLADLPALAVTGQSALAYALLVAAPPFALGDTSQFQDPGVPHLLSEYDDQPPSQVVDQLTREGGEANVPFDFTVYARRLANFKARTAPATPDYLVPLEPAAVTLTEDDTQLYSTLRLTYTDRATGAATVVTVTDPSFAGRFGFSRTKVLPGGTKTAQGARQFAQTWLALHSQRWESVTVTRPLGRGVELFAGGAGRSSWWVRAGQWAMVGDRGPYVCVRTQYDAHSGQLSSEWGQPAPGWPQELAALRRTEAAVRRGVNPSTGAAA